MLLLKSKKKVEIDFVVLIFVINVYVLLLIHVLSVFVYLLCSSKFILHTILFYLVSYFGIRDMQIHL